VSITGITGVNGNMVAVANSTQSVAPPMRRLTQAPNLALATLWSDMRTQVGFTATVLRANASSIAGEIPLDQALPEIWLFDDDQVDAAKLALVELKRPPSRHWVCRQCLERNDGPFFECWQCATPWPGETDWR
jgi:hypothetical protein